MGEHFTAVEQEQLLRTGLVSLADAQVVLGSYFLKIKMLSGEHAPESTLKIINEPNPGSRAASFLYVVRFL